MNVAASYYVVPPFLSDGMKIRFENEIIRVYESALYRTTSTVIDLGEAVLVTDPNWLPDEVEAIKNHVSSLAEGKELYLFFTHSDFDHILGYGAFNKVRVITSSAMAANAGKDAIIREVEDFDQRYYIKRPYGVTYPATDILIEQSGQTVIIGNTEAEFLLAPGHTADGTVIILKDHGIILAGDYLSNIEFPFIYHDHREYIQTLLKIRDKVTSLENTDILLVPGHGDIAFGKEEIISRIDKDLKYLELLYKQAENPCTATQQACMEHILTYSDNPFLADEHAKNLTRVSLPGQ